MTNATSSARPSALVGYTDEARRVASMVWSEASALAPMLDLVARRCGSIVGTVPDAVPVARLADAIADNADWVLSIAEAFAAAGGEATPTAMTSVVFASTARLDLAHPGWVPTGHLFRGDDDAWWRAVFPMAPCAAGPRRYDGNRSYIVGPDGRAYPLVVPVVTRDGQEYNAGPGVRDLDGVDPGWHTICVRGGVERHRDEPSWLDRLLTADAATVSGPPVGSTRADVQAVEIPLDGPPYFVATPPARSLPDDPPTEPSPTPKAAAVEAVPIAVDALAGATGADLGAHDAYQVEFQQNDDGRVRALFRRVDVGFDEDGDPVLESSYVVGPSLNDTVPINDAPP